MNRQTRTLLVLLVALGAAGAASFAVYRAITNLPARTVETPTTYAVVAASDMPVGSLVTKSLVKLVPWPSQTPLKGGFTEIEAVVNRGLLSGVSENEPLTETKLAPKEAGAGLPPTIKPGMRAMSVQVNEVIGVAGFVVPGTHVDVLTVLTPPNKQNVGRMARTVVSNVQVLTAGTRYDQEEARKDGKAIRSTVVTLMVSPSDAERISLSQAEGQLMLALRNPLDADMTQTQGVMTASLFSGSATPIVDPTPVVRRAAVVAAVAPPPPPPPVPAVYRVETIRGAKRAEEVVNP